MSKFGISQSVRRVEDARLVTGGGNYMDDVNVAGQAYGYVVRSAVAHARISSIDTAAARATPGVLDVITAAELDADNCNRPLPCLIPMENRDGSERADPMRPVLNATHVRFVGDAIAFVVADSLAVAKDAAERIEIDLQALPAAVETDKADRAGQAQVHDQAPNNLAFDWAFGETDEVDATFKGAAHQVKLELINNRVIVNAMETRGVVAEYDGGSGKLTVHTGTQGGWMLKDWLVDVFQTSADKVRVITPDVGGGFGMKAMIYPELALTAIAARRVGKPVKWIADRGESFLSDNMGRDHVTTAELALDKDHTIVAMRVETVSNMGAYLSLFAPFIPTGAALKVLPGVYDVKKLYYRVKGVFTHTTPVDAYRGAGRPESIYTMERLIEHAARQLGVDPVELRKRNFIAAESMPFTTAAGEVYDTGEFSAVMDAALKHADWQGFEKRRRQAEQQGLRRGIGMGYYIESTMGEPSERADIRFTADGAVQVLVGTQSNGQGHETAYAQILSDKLGVPFERVQIVQGDTDTIAAGGGTGGSRSVTAEGWAISDAAAAVVERGKQFAAQHFEAASADIEFNQGEFRVAGTDRSVDVMDLAEKARSMNVPGYDGGLDDGATVEIAAWTFPNGCHIAEVQIDPDTGVVEVVGYTVVDDFGRLINPMLVEGQVHGGVVQGLGQALMEHAVYDDDGQLITGSFMDYCMPRADNMPAMSFDTVEIPCKNNPLGMKGCGEAGSVGSCAAVINAIIHALVELGVDRVDMPATPEKLWQLMQHAA